MAKPVSAPPAPTAAPAATPPSTALAVSVSEVVPASASELAAPTPLTPEQRADRARKAALARWNKRISWADCPLHEAKEALADLQSELAWATDVVLRRMSVEEVMVEVKCSNPDCGHIIDVAAGKYACCRTRTNPDNGLPETHYACSSRCWLIICKLYPYGSQGSRLLTNPADGSAPATAATAVPDGSSEVKP